MNHAPQPVGAVAGEIASLLRSVPLRSDDEIRAEILRENQETIRHRSRRFESRLVRCAAPRNPWWLERVKEPRLRALAERYELERGSVLVVGPSGIGKTLTAMAIARRLLATAYRAGNHEAPIVRAVWTSGPELARALRETRLGSAAEALAEARGAPVLVLDEIGQESAAPGWLLELLDERYRKRAPTLTTSGLTVEEIEKRYGSGAARRLVQPVGDTLNLFARET
jgi:hypothetical protein